MTTPSRPESVTSRIFVDTSALFALLSSSDAHHREARDAWGGLLDPTAPLGLSTHDHVVVEASALVQHRLGLEALRVLHERVLPAISVEPVDPSLRHEALVACLAAGRRELSLVDWTSFQFMRRQFISTAFTFDNDFASQGFEVVPALA